MLKSFLTTTRLSRPMLILTALLAAVCNMHLLQGEAPSALIFRADRVASGEWYRLLTHPLVHVSWYHFTLDALCMALLYQALQLPRWKKFASVVLCGGTSLAYSLLASPYIESTGYCGLSGIAHGFMFLVGWTWLFPGDKHQKFPLTRSQTLGLLFCLVSLAKSLWEVYSGQILFQQSHTGYLGTPIVHSHLGGVFGAILSVLLLAPRKIIN